MGIKKQYIKNKSICKVNFRLPEEEAGSARTAHVVGEFNNWDTHANPMKKLKSGAFTATVNLKSGKEYQFRYLLDETTWETDFDADRFETTPFGNSENSVIIV